MKAFKFIVLGGVFLISSISAYSQEYFEKGRIMIGGGAFFSYSTDEESSNSIHEELDIIGNNIQEETKKKIYISPYFGLFIKKNFLVGVELNYKNSIQEIKVKASLIEPISQNTSSFFTHTDKSTLTLGINLFVRKTWLINEKFGAYLQPTLYFSNTKIEDLTIRTSNNEFVRNRTMYGYNTLGLGTGLGLYYLITNRFSLETTLGIISFDYSKNTKYGDDHFGGSVQIDDHNFNFDFVNTLSFDQLFTVNYYF